MTINYVFEVSDWCLLLYHVICVLDMIRSMKHNKESDYSELMDMSMIVRFNFFSFCMNHWSTNCVIYVGYYNCEYIKRLHNFWHT